MPKRKLQGNHSEPKPLRQRAEYTRKVNNCAMCHSVWTTPMLEDGCIPCNMWCSYCGQWSDNDSYGDACCHNCGARMDETEPPEKEQ